MSVTITKRAADLILNKLQEPATIAMQRPNSVATLRWAQRVYSTDRVTGERTEHGPMFSFSWVDQQSIKDYDYLFLPLPDGSEIALAGGKFYRAGSYRVDVKDGKLTLVGAP